MNKEYCMLSAILLLVISAFIIIPLRFGANFSWLSTIIFSIIVTSVYAIKLFISNPEYGKDLNNDKLNFVFVGISVITSYMLTESIGYTLMLSIVISQFIYYIIDYSIILIDKIINLICFKVR